MWNGANYPQEYLEDIDEPDDQQAAPLAFAVLLGPDAEPELVKTSIRLIPGVDSVSAQTGTPTLGGLTWDDIAALRASNERLREAVALLNSMVLSGESHSQRSRQVVRDAVTAPW